ncbi:MAG TPA: flagella basal body P-ring formation protein FlgA [Polyangiales bacterium]|nr:flagella basal body P-ring formation protein FlgA [Polyangiales bacterium]
MNTKIKTLCATALLLALPYTARAQDAVNVDGERVTLAMILPALSGTELGDLDLAPAPLPGETSVIRASDVKAKLKESGRDARGLMIPKSVKLVRKKRTVEGKELDGLVKAALAPRVAPCNVEELSTLTAVTLGEGDFEVEAEPMPRKQSGRTSAMVTLHQGERKTRLSIQAVLTCPEPVMAPGMTIRLIVRRGAVTVTAPGVANQPGRVGDEIRVTNTMSKKALMGRVIDAQSVEVLQ